MKYGSAVANETGVSFEMLAAMIGTVSSTTRLSAEMIGMAFRTIFLRMSNVKAGVSEFEGETLNNVEKVLNRLNIKLRDSADSFRPFEEVIEEIAGRWEDLSEVERAQVATAVAG